jgi:GNAT superfamily N-acetyltransferase
MREGVEYHHVKQGRNPGYNLVAASHQDKVVGHMSWGPGQARVNQLWVRPDYRREGVASALWHHASTIQPDLVHHPDRSNAGNAFAHSVSPEAPERKHDSSDAAEDERRGDWTARQITERIRSGHRTVRKICLAR